MSNDDGFASGQITDLAQWVQPYVPDKDRAMAISLLPVIEEAVEDVSAIYTLEGGPSKNTPEQNAALVQQRPWTRRDDAEDKKDVMWSPGNPIAPIYDEHSPRAFDYRTGQNFIYTPRAGYDLVPFPYLRNLAKASQEVRIVFEMVKREIRALDFEIAPTVLHGSTEGVKDIEAFIESPDGFLDFDAWVNALMEEILVIDAPCFHPVFDRAGRFQALELVAGDTIGPLLDARGRIPKPPIPAYRQIIKGLPLSWYSTQELIYKPFNASVSSPYGASPTEYILLSVNLALRRAALHVENFTSGNIPAAIMGAPESWSMEQIKEWQRYWDALITGKLSQQVKVLWVPHEGGGNLAYQELRKDDITSTTRDEWLMKVACWAVGASPSEFGITQGGALGSKGMSETQQSTHFRNLIGPYTQYISRILNRIIHRVIGYPHLAFKWQNIKSGQDTKTMAETDQIYVSLGAYGVDYIQDRDGIPAEFRQSAKAAQQEAMQQQTAMGTPAATPTEAGSETNQLQSSAPQSAPPKPGPAPSPTAPINMSPHQVATGQNVAATAVTALRGITKGDQPLASPFGGKGVAGKGMGSHRKATRTNRQTDLEQKLSGALRDYLTELQTKVVKEVENAHPG